MNHQDLYKLLQTVQKNIHCPQCGKAYDFDHISIRGIVESIVFLELSCKNHMPVLATVTLNHQSKKKTARQEKISHNDIIETHRFLKNFSGGFDQAFKKKY